MWRGRRIPANIRVSIALAVLLVLVIISYITIERNIFPVIVTMGEAQVQALAIRAMNDAVKSTMKNPDIYTDLIRIVTADDGTVAMVQSNTALINDLSTQINNTVQNNLANMGEQGLRISLGSIMGSQLLSGRGPRISIRIVPVGTVQSVFRTEFENAGINQTRHKIIMTSTATISIVLPGNNSRNVQVKADIPISESIIIGKVPDSYVNVGDAGGLLYKEALE